MRNTLWRRTRRAATLAASTTLVLGALTVGSVSAQRCEDCEPGGGGGGTGGGPTTPVVYRHVALEGRLNLYDHEGGNGYTRCEGSGGDYFRYDLQAPVGQWTTSRRDSFCGGEVRLETRIAVRPNADGTLDYRGEQLLYEGTTTHSNDLGGKATITESTVAPGATTGLDVSAFNGNEQGHLVFNFGQVDDTFQVSLAWVHDTSDPTDYTISRFRIHNV
ncbi:hypothetical protein ACFRCG_04360 [Embleya sp. NPDC056575]|uniref:hypothetical protein n=1 Tax=unclassified Embleya TaxID=2699296 RepID=UPI003677DE93